MIEMILKCTIILSALASASFLQRQSPQKARKIYAITFLLVTATCIAFSVAQAAGAVGLLRASLTYTPFDLLSLLGVVYWVSWAVSKGAMFDRMIGEEGT